LVSPVLHPGQQNKIVYLPEGSWYYYFDNTFYEGGQEYTIDTPLDEMPFFVRGGSIIPEYPIMQFTGERRVESLRLNLYYAEGEHESNLYSDHGETFAYEQGVYVEKHFIANCDSSQVSIMQGEDGIYTPYYNDFNLYLIGLPFEPKQITVDGVKVQLQKDEEGQNYIKLERDFKKINIQ
jgi:alpha-glucosidase